MMNNEFLEKYFWVFLLLSLIGFIFPAAWFFLIVPFIFVSEKIYVKYFSEEKKRITKLHKKNEDIKQKRLKAIKTYGSVREDVPKRGFSKSAPLHYAYLDEKVSKYYKKIHNQAKSMVKDILEESNVLLPDDVLEVRGMYANKTFEDRILREYVHGNKTIDYCINETLSMYDSSNQEKRCRDREAFLNILKEIKESKISNQIEKIHCDAKAFKPKNINEHSIPLDNLFVEIGF